jgi:thiamine monophosphate kinase
MDFALYGGEDFELLFSFEPNKLAEIEKALSSHEWHIIGKVTDSGQVTYRQNHLIYNVDLNRRWSHF